MAGALAGLKVVELGEMVSAPYAAKLMADMGAEVVKIERPGAGDGARLRGPFPGGQAHREKSGLYLYLNTNKLGVTLDVSRPEGFELLEQLVAGADVLIHNVVPSEMDRIGLSFERLHARNPRLVMTSISPWGQSGPKRDWRAADLTLWSASGICYINGGGSQHPEMPPLKAFGQQAGFQGGVHAAVATMGAVLAQTRDGEGQHVEVSIYESLAAQMELFFEFWPYMNMVASRLGQKPIQPLEVMECRDGYIFVCCVEEHQWRNLVELMGNPEWAGEELFSDRLKRGVNWDALKVFMEEWVKQQSVLDLYAKGQARRIPLAPVSTMGDLLGSEHLKKRGFFVEITHPVAGTHKYPGAPLKYHRTPWEIRSPAPTLGQHNEEIFGARLGLKPARIEELRRAGVV